MYRDHYPPPQTPWASINQPRNVYSAYPAAAHELLEPHSTFSRYPAAAYLTSAVRQSAMAPMRTFLTATQDEKAAIGADPEMLAALGVGAGLLLALAAANIAGAYFAGRAMAPTKAERNAYGIGTAVANAFLGPLGFLGAAGYSVSKQGLPMSYELLSGLGTAVDVPGPTSPPDAPSCRFDQDRAQEVLIFGSVPVFFASVGMARLFDSKHPWLWGVAVTFAMAGLGGMMPCISGGK